LLVRLSLPYFIIPHAYVYIAALLHRYSINSVLHFPITTIRKIFACSHEGSVFGEGGATSWDCAAEFGEFAHGWVVAIGVCM
jgi:hypothetical protein